MTNKMSQKVRGAVKKVGEGAGTESDWQEVGVRSAWVRCSGDSQGGNVPA